MDAHINNVLAFWFGEIKDGFSVEDRNDLWFRSTPEADQDIKVRFGDLVEQALAGELNDWAQQAKGRLALVILLDQFTRNIYRRQAKAFAGDAKVLQLAREGITLGHDRQLEPIERRFFYLPFEHSEDLADQNRCIALYEALRDELPETRKENGQSSVDYAIKHQVIIERFDRFPHRNQVLGRESTPEEIEFLKDSNTFGQ